MKSYGLLFALALTPFSLEAKSLCSPSPQGEAAYNIGLAQTSITPWQKLPIAGYGTYYGTLASTRQNGEGVHDPIYASTLWLEEQQGEALALVALDLVGISQASVKRVEKSLAQHPDLGAVQLVLSASHTHHAPDVLGLWGALPFFTGRNKEYMAFMEKSIIESVLAAKQRARCAHITYAEGFKETDWHPYLPKGSEREETITSLLFRDQLSGEELGSLTQWAAHPTVLEENNNAISSDYPGAFREAMREKRAGIPIYVNGMLGASYIPLKDTDIAPDPFILGARDPDVSIGYEQQAYHGYDLAAKVDQALLLSGKALQQQKLSVKRQRFDLPVSNQSFKLADRAGIIEDRGLSKGKVNTEIVWVQIGELQLATLPGEMFPSGTGQIRSALAALRPEGSPVMLLGIGNDWLGYLMSDKEFDDSRYSYHKSLAPDAQAMNLIVKQYRELLGKATQERSNR